MRSASWMNSVSVECGIADDDAGDIAAGQVIDADLFDVTGQVAVGELPGHPVALPDHFGGDGSGGVLTEHLLDDLCRVEGADLFELEGRERDRHRTVGCNCGARGQPELFEDRTRGMPTASRREDDRNPGRHYSPD